MDRQTQMDFILDHYERPRHYGAPEGASVAARGSNPGCGDAVTFYLRADGGDRITGLSFEGEGCTISLAGASVVAELMQGRTLAEAEALSPDRIVPCSAESSLRRASGVRPWV